METSVTRARTVQLIGVLVGDVNGYELPVHFALVNHSVTAQHFRLQNSACSVQLGADLACVHRVVVACINNDFNTVYNNFLFFVPLALVS